MTQISITRPVTLRDASLNAVLCAILRNASLNAILCAILRTARLNARPRALLTACLNAHRVRPKMLLPIRMTIHNEVGGLWARVVVYL